MTTFCCKDRTTIVAEMAQSYEGSLEVASTIASDACKAGADAVLFQVVYADELAIPGNNRFDLFRTLEMPDSSWRQLIEATHASGGLALGEVFGSRSTDVVIACEIDGLKIHAADIANLPFLRYVSQFNLPILLSAGGSTLEEIRVAIDALRTKGNPEIVLMHGYQVSPTDIEDSHLLKLLALSEAFGLPVGYADHVCGCVDGNVANLHPLALTFPLLAIGAGAQVIEKHVILDRSKAWEDCESAITPQEFGQFVSLVRAIEGAAGEKSLDMNQAELAYRGSARKYIVASCDLGEGTVIEESHAAFKRIEDSTDGLMNLSDVVGKRALRVINRNAVIRRSDIVETNS